MRLLALDGTAVDGSLYTWLAGLAQRAPSWLDGPVARPGGR
ncbi:hypothetical protein [Streptomyces goshikiensis]